MGMRFPVGPMRGRAKPNPWLYLTPDERLEAEREIFRTMATPGQAMDMLHYADPRNPMGAYDPIATQQNLYEQMLKNAEGQIESKVVEPLGAAGYPNLAGGIGAVGSAMTQMIPGPNEGLPFMSGGLGMAGGKVKNLWEHMTPEARKIAEEAHEKLRKEMMESSVADQAGPIDPYAPEVSAGGDRRINPYEALQEQERRTLDPDTGLPIERRDEYSRGMTQDEVDSNRRAEQWKQEQAEAAAKKAEARKQMSFRERMDEDVEEYWDDQWSQGNIDDYLWEDWGYSRYDEIPTRGDEMERLQDAIRYNDDLKKGIKEKIKDEVTDDWIDPDGGVSVTDLKDVLPDDFVDWAKKNYPDDLEEVRQNGYISNDNEHLLDEWAEEMADEYIEKKIREYEPDADDWDEELDWWDDDVSDFDLDNYGDERIYGPETRYRRFRQERDLRFLDTAIEDVFPGKKNRILNDIYSDHLDSIERQNVREWWEDDFIGEYLQNEDNLLDDLPDDVDEWDAQAIKDSYRAHFDYFYGTKEKDIYETIGGVVGDEEAKKISSKRIKEVVDEINYRKEKYFEKAYENEVAGSEDKIIERLKKAKKDLDDDD